MGNDNQPQTISKQDLVELEKIFKKGSKTYFNSSLFFEKPIREKIIRLYAFVRVVDDIVDNNLPLEVKKNAFEKFYSQYQKAKTNLKSDNLVINSFIKLENECVFDPKWTEAFFSSMNSDIYQTKYITWQDTLKYIYGSANVIGLYMAKVLDLPAISYPYAEKLGQAMQLINFIRDIKEDIELGRSYFPSQILSKYGIFSFDEKSLKNNSSALINELLEVYFDWQNQAQIGFKYIPKKYLIPIKTASDMYIWTAKQIQRNPNLVFIKKIKPSKLKILIKGLQNWLTIS